MGESGHFNLSSFDKYYINNQGKKMFFDSYVDALKYLSDKRGKIAFNYESIFSVLSNLYMVGDNTLIDGIYRTPWFSDVFTDEIIAQSIPQHGNAKMSTEDIGFRLHELLKEEIKLAIGQSKHVGILLSGGMDSRIVAGVLHNLMKVNAVSVDKVVAFNWGEENSRDYQYAKKIAQELGWDFRNYRVNSEDVWKNIVLSATRGCEYSGVHLHAMPRIGFDSVGLVDIILAGSYGDSVGRAEFSGKHATKLTDMKKHWGGYASMLNSSISKSFKKSYIETLDKYRGRFKNRELWQVYEIERQCHYMRRMLNPCMETIHEKTPLYQAFTHPKVFGFMWSLDSSLRNDNVYSELIKYLDPVLREIPWARTGMPYGKQTAPDSYKKTHHRYSDILSIELLDKIEQTVLACNMFSKNRSVYKLFELLKDKPGHNFDYLERSTYICSLALFYNEHKDMLGDFAMPSAFLDKERLASQYLIKRALRQRK